MAQVSATRWTRALFYSVFTSAFVYDFQLHGIVQRLQLDETTSSRLAVRGS